jgi:hypothetical protein
MLKNGKRLRRWPEALYSLRRLRGLGVEGVDGRPVEPDGPDPAGLVDLQTYELTHRRSLLAVRPRF